MKSGETSHVDRTTGVVEKLTCSQRGVVLVDNLFNPKLPCSNVGDAPGCTTPLMPIIYISSMKEKKKVPAWSRGENDQAGSDFVKCYY